MRTETEEIRDNLKYLSLLARDYPSQVAAASEIISTQALLKLPKGTEHFMSDLHGENEAFVHILNSASGVIREKVDIVLGDTVPEGTRAELATLIYYPNEKLPQLKERCADEEALEQWYSETLLRLIDICRLVSSKHTREHVRACLPSSCGYILDELLHAHFEDHDKDLYYGQIVGSIIENGRADKFIVRLCELIKRLAVDKLHIVGDLFDRETAAADNGGDFDLANPGNAEDATAKSSAPKTIQSSAAAYRDLNATLGNFYEQPKNDNAEMDELLERIASLESKLESEKDKASAMDDQVALMEKSYELAAKYMGGQNGTQPPVGQAAEPYPVQKAGKNTAKPVRQVTHQVVSSLSQPMSNAEFVASFSQERNRSFNTAVGVTTVSDKNTISACVYGAQSVTDGQAVKLRLLEPMEVADKIIPRNAVVVGTAKIQGERLDIGITSLEYDGTIIPVELAVYDTDGQPGIFIPNSMEMNAVREVAANMGGSLGSSINISTNAGAQLASDLGKGLIQGTSQYIAKKMRTVKVHLKSGYKVMLYQDRD